QGVLVQRAGQLITFTELTARPANGLTFNGVTFGFKIAGVDSTDATFGGTGPGTTTFVVDPSLEGNINGVLTLDLAQPSTALNFGLAYNIFTASVPNGGTVKLFDASNNLLET